MTRINVEHPQLLCNQHLHAEWYEQPRVVTAVIKLQGKVDIRKIPSQYTVRTAANPSGGKGHMYFFYNKLRWLRRRYLALMQEMRRRGLNTSDNWNPEIFEDKYLHLFGEYSITEQSRHLNRTRIMEKMPPKPRFFGDVSSVLKHVPEYQDYFLRGS